MPLLRDAAEATEEELAAVREQFVTHFMIADLDFDGHPDLAGIWRDTASGFTTKNSIGMGRIS